MEFKPQLVLPGFAESCSKMYILPTLTYLEVGVPAVASEIICFEHFKWEPIRHGVAAALARREQGLSDDRCASCRFFPFSGREFGCLILTQMALTSGGHGGAGEQAHSTIQTDATRTK